MNTFAPTVAPTSHDFVDCLDPRIRDTVVALAKKGFLTCYSCDGHVLTKPRYVVLAFGSEAAREDFCRRLVTAQNRLFLSLERLDTLSVEVVRGVEIRHQSKENEIRGFNYLFGKTYEDYFFLRINIGFAIYNSGVEATSDLESIVFKVRELLVSTMNLFVREFATTDLYRRVINLRA